MANRTIGTEIKLTGEKEFNQQMKAINSGLKTTKSDMAALSSEFADNANSMQALTQKQKLLQSSVDQHKAKVEALKNQYEAAAAAYGENSAAAQKYKQQLNQATIALNKESAALEANADAMKDKYLAGLRAVASGAGNLFTGIGKGVGTAAAGVAKGVGAITAASAAGVAAIGAGGVIALTTMASMAREAAEAAKAAQEAGETLTESQQQWLAYSGQLDALDASVANAKGALAGILLPMLGDLSTEGAAFLNDFTQDMTAAAGDTGKQTQVLSDYIVKGARLIKEKLPEYIATGKELFAGLAEGLSENSDELLDMGLDLVYDLLDGIIENAPALAAAGVSLVEKLTASLIEQGPDLLESAMLMVSEITSGLAQAAPSLIPAAVQLVMQLLTTLIENAPLLLEAGLELILGIISGILAGLGDIGQTADAVIDEFVGKMLGSENKVLQLGGKVVDWIRTGISNAWSGLVSWFDGIWNSLFNNRSITVGVNGRNNNDSGGGGGNIKPAVPDGSLACGLDYVPFDGYLARLHRGEAVLTASEAAAYRRGQSGQTVKQFNLTIHTQSLSKEDLNMIVSYVNGKLGDDL